MPKDGSTTAGDDTKLLCLGARIGRVYRVRHGGEEMTIRLVGRRGRLEMLFRAPESFEIVREEAIDDDETPRAERPKPAASRPSWRRR